MSEDTTKEMPSSDDRVIASINALRVEMENRFDAIHRELDATRQAFDSRLNVLEEKVDRLETKVDRLEAKVDRLETKVDRLETKVDRLETKVDNLEKRVTDLEEKVDNRLRETQPIWQSVLAKLEVMDTKFGIISEELLDLRGETMTLKRKLSSVAELQQPL